MADNSIVGVRELRQNLSVYLRRVEAGETLEVTSRGQPVAVLAPRKSEALGSWDRLVAEGKITPPTKDFADLPPPLPAKGKKSISEALQEIRADRI